MTSRQKPRVRKADDGWRIDKPGYGFGPGETLGPFRSHRDALAALQPSTASAGASASFGPEPHASQYRWRGHTLYPMKIQ